MTPELKEAINNIRKADVFNTISRYHNEIELFIDTFIRLYEQPEELPSEIDELDVVELSIKYEFGVEDMEHSAIAATYYKIAIDLATPLINRLKLELEQARKETGELRTILQCWHNTFGTTQLTHASARLEAAEDRVERMKHELDEARAEIERLKKFEGLEELLDNSPSIEFLKGYVTEGISISNMIEELSQTIRTHYTKGE